MPRLLLGPAIRHVGRDSAVVWVQATRACEIEVRLFREGRAERRHQAKTFSVHGRHYALVATRPLLSGCWYEYEVWARREGGSPVRVWPERRPGPKCPMSSFRTQPAGGYGEVRLAVVSCRAAASHDSAGDAEIGVDALKLLARRLRRQYPMRRVAWPQAIVELGDQIYADSLSTAMETLLRPRRERLGLPVDEAIDFPEFALVYEEAWSDEDVRWMRSCIPSISMFDDHEIVDDWNINARWVADQRAEPWRMARIRSGLLAYWIYQGAGNLAPAEWASDRRMRTLCGPGTSAAGSVRDVTARAEALFGRYAGGAEAARWGFERSLGAVRLIVGDCRAKRDLAAGKIMDDDEWNWFAAAVRKAREPHLVLVLSLPALLPDGMRELESSSAASQDFPWNLDPLAAVFDAAIAGGTGKSARHYIQERVDLEHWPAFPDSMEALIDLLTERLTAPGQTTRTLTLLSGDVHFSYAMAGRISAAPGRPVHQLVVSPARNRLGRGEEQLFRIMAGPHGRAVVDLARALGAAHGLAGILPINPKSDAAAARITTSLLPLGTGNLLFDNVVATMRIGPAGAEFHYEAASGTGGKDVPGYGGRALRPVGRVRLALA